VLGRPDRQAAARAPRVGQRAEQRRHVPASLSSRRYQAQGRAASCTQRATSEVLPAPGSPTSQVSAWRRCARVSACSKAARRTWSDTRGMASL
jgi:hypothetical protein